MAKRDLRTAAVVGTCRGMKAKRLFAGVRVEATEALRGLAADLRRELREERIRWDRLEHPHVTVWFFGETAAERIPELMRALQSAAAEVPAFTMAIGGPGVFGSARHPRVVWLEAEAGTGLRRLFAALAARLRETGREPEAREFAPHLTLGRISELRDARRFGEALERRRGIVVQEQRVREGVLFESLAQPGGARHVPLAAFPLRGS